MRYRVHFYATVRVEYELEANSAEEAALQALGETSDLHQRLAGPRQEYAEHIEDDCLVDPLTEHVRAGRLVPDFDKSRWLRLVSVQLPSGEEQTQALPAAEKQSDWSE